MTSCNEPIAIIGSGCRFPGGSSQPSKLWGLLQTPRDVASKIPIDRFNVDGFYHMDGSHHGTTNVQDSYFLEEDHRRFDAQFFNIQPAEAESIDPQQRVLLEVVYEGLEAAGLTLKGLQGSSTAVYVGLMNGDYNDVLFRDLDSIPTYTATGMARSIIANRLSYFFDWHGPSMTIDTACSSSLVALHQAVQVLRSGESHVAIAAGANLIIGPEMYVAESKLNMLSPTGRSRMWDERADGYARGDGVAAVVLKRLSDAIRDGDHVESIIRETGVNQDGRSKGITMPSAAAQCALIRRTYERAGLDPCDPAQRCQYFEAHGTGTKAGDPIEAEAISKAFFDSSNRRHTKQEKLYVGSIKTVIGHTEGTAGLAGVLKVSLALQKKLIPPNLLFNKLNPALEPYYHGVEIPTKPTPWPEVPSGRRRASVNSFGFGGTNAHAILESYDHDCEQCQVKSVIPVVTPLVLSANSEKSLVSMVESYSSYLDRSSSDLCLRNLVWTLQTRRSAFPFRTSFSGVTVGDIKEQLRDRLNQLKESKVTLALKTAAKSPRILGVFTGQGAQWASMGRHIIEATPDSHVSKTLNELEESLQSLPDDDRPTWSLREELIADASISRLSEAALAQPLCTALQIILVDMLHSAGIKLSAVVGHSSGEIGAAYAAGLITSRDAIRIAYYRGLYAKLAKGPTGQPGAMLAVGTDLVDAKEICSLPMFEGRISLAACNSSASMTLSGDADAIDEAKTVFDDENKFARRLKVDTAYHSSHMEPCSQPYIESLHACKITARLPSSTENRPAWYSSVESGKQILPSDKELEGSYWVDNMLKPVLFSEAIVAALTDSGPFDAAIEVGPHPALKGPATQTIQELTGQDVLYSGVLKRGENDLVAFSAALGYLWTHFDAADIDFAGYDSFVTGSLPSSSPVKDLPTYPWDHERLYWRESRTSKVIRTRATPHHPLLGVQTPDSTEDEIRWRNLLKPKEISWLHQHQLQGQIVFPAAAYVAMALEASKTLCAGATIQLIEIENVAIGRAITFDDADSGIEVLFSVTGKTACSEHVTAAFHCYSPVSKDSSEMALNASGTLRISLGEPSANALPGRAPAARHMVDVNIDNFYAALAELGYGYSGHFRGMSGLQRKAGVAQGFVTKPSSIEWENNFLVHPATLDVAFQAVFAGYCSPGDGRLYSLRVPTSIDRISVDPSVLCDNRLRESEAVLPFDSVLTSDSSRVVHGDVKIYTADSSQAVIQVEGVAVVPFVAATEADDRILFSNTIWTAAKPDGNLVVAGERATAAEIELGVQLERMSFYYLRTLHETFTESTRAQLEWHHQSLLHFADHIVQLVKSSEHIFAKKEWMCDTHDEILKIVNRYTDRHDVKLTFAVGEHLPAVLRGETTILEHMTADALLDDFYRTGLGFPQANEYIARMAGQLALQYPHANILEIGAGTGGATKRIMHEIWPRFASYTYTDISTGFFETAQEVFKKYASRIVFKALDIGKDVLAQGFVEESYDIIIASNVLHATKTLEHTMSNVRRLLKPGGYLLLLETSDAGPMRIGFVMGGLPGWWVGKDDGRLLAPTISPSQWNNLLQKTGFSGVDTITPNNDLLPFPFFVLASQAVDRRVELIRSPLLAAPEELHLDNVLIVGGHTIQLSNHIRDCLNSRSTNVTVVPGVEDAGNYAMQGRGTTTVIFLADLDEPIFKNITAGKLEGLKRLFDISHVLLWVTQGCRSKEPYHNMSVGLGRSLALEYPDVRLQYLDLDPSTDIEPHLIIESLLRHYLQTSWYRENQKMISTIEPELAYEDGQCLVPRIVPNKAQNERYNSDRRIITTKVSVEHSQISVIANDRESAILTASRLPSPLVDHSSILQIRVSTSTVYTVPVSGGSCMYFLIGTDVRSKQKYLALSTVNASLLSVPLHRAVPCNVSVRQEPDLIVYAVYRSIVLAIKTDSQKQRKGSIVLVHEPDEVLTELIRRTTWDTQLVLTTTTKRGIDNPFAIQIHPKDSRHDIQSKLPIGVTTVFDFSSEGPSELTGRRILSALRPRVESATSHSDLLRGGSRVQVSETQDFTGFLIDLSSGFNDYAGPTFRGVVQTVSLNTVAEMKTCTSVCPVIDWSLDENVSVQVVTADSQQLFSGEKTYLLIGLTGQLGQSLCQWMISRGARFICITSRNPNVDQQWLDDMSDQGATIEVLSMDITDKKSILAGYHQLCDCMPPVAGVVNAAMVLEDTMFANMSFEVLDKVLRPKVDGSHYLDQLFPENTLDFFILFSSIACVMGNKGQSNYSAANMFMTSLARQRRERGLAASVIDISGIVGIGYISRVGQEVLDSIRRTGAMAISEQDYHQMFAEAVLGGRPSSTTDSEIITGLRTVRRNDPVQVPWIDNPRFSHFVQDREFNQHQVKGSSKTIQSARALITQAGSMEEVYEAIKECFSIKLRATLLLSDEETIDMEAPLIQLGVDSLVAVEIRSWFLKEVEVDIPVLKVLGGDSFAGLLDHALQHLPIDLIKHIETCAHNTGRTTPDNESSSISLTVAHMEIESGSSDESVTQRSTKPSSATSENDTDSTSEQQVSDELMALQSSEQMSFGQSRFWFLKEFLQDQTTFNIVLSARISGPLIVSDLERAVRVAGERHESLRTRFFSTTASGNRLGVDMQGVLKQSLLRLERRVISDTAEFHMAFDAMEQHVFDLERGETMRIILLSSSPTSHFLIIACHHIIMDEVSLQVLLSDLESVYMRAPLPPMIQYPAFSRRQRMAYESGKMSKSLDFWKAALSSLPPPLPLFPFQTKTSRPLVTRYQFNRFEGKLSASVVKCIKDLCRNHQSTSFHFYVAVLRIMLLRFLSTENFCIGVADANRNDSDVSRSVGCFLNLLPLCFNTQGDQQFSHILQDTRTKTFDALAHSEVPFDVIMDEVGVPRSSTSSPLFQTFVDYRLGVKEKKKFADCHMERDRFIFGRTGYDLCMDVIENIGEETSIVFMLQRDLYTQDHAALLMKSYLHLVEVFSQNPTTQAQSVPLFDKADTSEPVAIIRGPSMDSLWSETVVHRVLDMTVSQSRKVALKDGQNTLTYGEMGQKVNIIARMLLDKGVHIGDTVGVFQEPTTDWICSLLAILLVGGVYLPLDQRIPTARLAHIVEECQPSVLLIHQETENECGALVSKDSTCVFVDVTKLSTNLASRLNAWDQVAARSNAAAMILYTSGSTGTPKMIVLKHSNIKNSIEAFVKNFNIGTETVLQQSALSFDFSIEQIFTALCNGGTLYVVPKRQRGDPVEISRLIAEENITMTGATASEYFSWMRYGSPHLLRRSKWKLAISGGEQFTQKLAEEFHCLGKPDLRILNIYGPTEATIASNKTEVYCAEVANLPSEERISVGPPIANCSIYVVDERGQLLPPGMPGEVMISGAGVADGYLNNSELTRASFLPDAFASPEYVEKGWTTVYRTGDRGLIKPGSKELIVLGRVGDNQVKLRGIRIELEDVEHAILKSSGGVLTHAFVSIHGETQYLVAHVVFRAGAISPAEQQPYLQRLQIALPLPQYMRPAFMVTLQAPPLTAHGKVDRRAVCALSITDSLASSSTTPSIGLTSTEGKLYEIWAEILPASVTFNVDSDFFHVGGNSLLLMKVQFLIRETFATRLALIDLFQSSTLRTMALLIDNSLTKGVEIDWDEETNPTKQITAISLPSGDMPMPARQAAEVVVLTGATGFLGKAIVRALLKTESIRQIHCVAVRDPAKLGEFVSSDKIFIHKGNLEDAQLGLSNAEAMEVFREADCIIHNGADVSFLKTYGTLKAANVTSTKELIKFALPRRMPFHFVSTVAVGRLTMEEQFAEVSVANFPPPEDGADGYTASKWASERYLERVGQRVDIPIFIHRPTSITGPGAPELDIMSNLLKFSRRLEAVPTSKAWSGFADFVAVERVAGGIVDSLARGVASPLNSYIHHCGDAVVPLDGLGPWLQDESYGSVFKTLTLNEWVGLAEKEGMNGLVAEYLRSIDGSDKVMMFKRVVRGRVDPIE